jgi:hypothetical protein
VLFPELAQVDAGEPAGEVVLYVEGRAPSRPGDHFDAYLKPPEPTGCTSGRLPGGGGFIMCRRSPPNAGRGRRRSFVFDPAIHEVLR